MYKWILDKTDTIWELLILYLIVITAASIGFTFTENIDFLDAVWLSFVTGTSTGYGDFYPKTSGGRAVAILLMHITLFFIIPLIVVRLMGLMVKDTNVFTHDEQEQIKNKIDILIERKGHNCLYCPPSCKCFKETKSVPACKTCQVRPAQKPYDHCGGPYCLPF